MAKKNLRTIPQQVKRQLARLKDRYVVAGCLRPYPASDLKRGRLAHLGVHLDDSGLTFPEAIIPPQEQGKFSDRNVNGHEVVRKDLPKETHYAMAETPNWGDPYYGTHTVYLPYKKYPRDYHGAKLSTIKIGAAQNEPGHEHYGLTFEVDRILDRRSKSFHADLLECLNLLQENVGACGVQKSGATTADYLQTLVVSWEILPPGTIEEAVARLFGRRGPSNEERKVVEDRYRFLMGLRPTKLIHGTSGFHRYFGGLLEDNLVVFENIEYGNAIYMMFKDWEELSKRSRSELLSGRYGENFERVPHSSGWKTRVRTLVRERRSGTASAAGAGAVDAADSDDDED